jgi:hypothetical protein
MKVTDRELKRKGEEIIVEGIVQANPTYHRDKRSRIYKNFREVLTLEILNKWRTQ